MGYVFLIWCYRAKRQVIQMLIWLLQHNLVTQQHTYIHLRSAPLQLSPPPSPAASPLPYYHHQMNVNITPATLPTSIQPHHPTSTPIISGLLAGSTSMDTLNDHRPSAIDTGASRSPSPSPAPGDSPVHSHAPMGRLFETSVALAALATSSSSSLSTPPTGTTTSTNSSSPLAPATTPVNAPAAPSTTYALQPYVNTDSLSSLSSSGGAPPGLDQQPSLTIAPQGSPTAASAAAAAAMGAQPAPGVPTTSSPSAALPPHLTRSLSSWHRDHIPVAMRALFSRIHPQLVKGGMEITELMWRHSITRQELSQLLAAYKHAIVLTTHE
jgi:hypothetical protein